jgi:cytochrome P450
MCPNHAHEDSTIFPDPCSFRPERWLGPETKNLEKYLMTFGQGMYKRLGIQLV